MPDLDTIIDTIRDHHRQRRFGMKIQQKLDRALESYVRIHFTDWSPDLGEEERDKFNREVKRLIKTALKGEGSDELVRIVAATERARAPADQLRKENERAMEELAEQLPVIDWIVSVHGAGAMGLATIVAETGNLSKYAGPAKVWKRLGYAPYEGLAGSTWKREKWRPRALEKEEWIENPFSGQRYALIHQVGVWLVNAQWIGKAKTEDGVGKPDGFYGEVYAKRRAHTAVTHPEWTPKHSQMDAVRITMKKFLLDLWKEWKKTTEETQREAAE